jgi:hypothetical protein
MQSRAKLCPNRSSQAVPRGTLNWFESSALRGRAPTFRCIASPRTIMSTIPSTSTSHSNFVSIFNAALETYKHKTKRDLASHPLLPSLQTCDSPEAVLAVLREQIPAFSQSQNGDDGLTEWVTPTVNVLSTFSATIGGGIGLVNIMMLLHE